MLSTNTPGAIYPYARFHALPRKLAKNKGDTGRAWRAAAFPILPLCEPCSSKIKIKIK